MTTKRSYKKKDLDKYVEENEIELIGEYEKVNRETRIQGKCKTEGCEDEFDRTFRQIVEKSGPKCHKCSDKRKSYKKADLDKYIEKNKIELIGEYEKVNAHTSIQGVCLTENCNNNFNKKFLELVKTNGYCYECSLKNSGRGVIFNIAFLNKYVDEHKLILLNEYTSTNRESNIKGKCKTGDCEEIFEKSFRQIIEVSGPYCKECTNINKGNKCKSTNLERRGVEYPTQSKEVIDLMKKNCNIKYGVDNISQLDNIKDKKKNTTLQSFGCEHYSQSKEFKKVIRRRRAIRNSKNITKLEEIIKKFNISIYEKYEEIEDNTIIRGKCINDNCNNDFNKKYDLLINGSGPYCYKCVMKNANRNNLYNIDFLNTYVDEFSIILNKEYTHTNREIIIEGKCLTDKCNGMFSKSFRQIIEVSGPYCKECTAKKRDDKVKLTNLDRYGTDYGLQNVEVIQKRNATRLEKYGCKSCGLFCVFNHLRKQNEKEDDLCDYCQPMKTNKLYQKTKEWLVVRKLREDLPDIPFIHNKSVGNECTLQDREDTNGHLYPDIRFELFGFDLIIEVDEHKHRGASYSCDERRIYEIIKQLGLPCVFIRYNPDDKKSDYNVLLEMIKEYLKKDMNEIDFNEHSGLKVEYLFY